MKTQCSLEEGVVRGRRGFSAVPAVKWIGLSLVLWGFAAVPAQGSDDPVARAMKLLEQRYYGQAAAALRTALPALDPGRQGAAHLTLGMIYQRTAELHRELHQASLAVNADYLKRLDTARGGSRSRVAGLYYGELLLETGKPDMAAREIEQFLATGGVDEKQRTAGKISLGIAALRSGDRQKAERLWSEAPGSDPEALAMLAAAYSEAGMNDKNPLALADKSLAQAKKGKGGPGMRLLASVVPVYVKAGRIDQAISLVSEFDLKSYSYKEVLGRSKVIYFYEYSLLRSLSNLYLQAAIASFERAVQDPKVRDTASYYLGAAYSMAGDIDQSTKALTTFIASPQMPQQFKDRAAARQAANHYEKGKQLDAVSIWDELSDRKPIDPDLFAEILFACSRLQVDCPKVLKKAVAAAEDGEGRRYATLNIALGRYYLGKKDLGRAVTHMEAGRDKSNKNKIESNDPAMFVNLAGAYFRTKQFSEALEIYFEMSKQFPEVRQIQEAMQGIYSMEHKSAGDVKIL